MSRGMSVDRRDFLRGAAWMGVAAVAGGCQLNRLGFGEGGSMQNFVYSKLANKRIRVGFVGIGSRGTGAVHRVSMIPGVDIVALCDRDPQRVSENLSWLKGKKYPLTPKSYVGDEAYKDLCDFGECDVVYCATPWALHQPVALRALKGGKLPLVEVTSALTTDESWELVEASEKYRIPCMQLENCVYGEIELLELNLARCGMFGEIVHAEGAYIHDLRAIIPSVGQKFNTEWVWRYGENMQHKGNRYPTHGLVPLCLTFDVNRGDRLDYLVSLESNQANFRAYMEANLAADNKRRLSKVRMADMNSTLIKTAKGKSLLIQHDVSTPRPYSRIQLVTGTKGSICDYPYRVVFEEKSGAGAHKWYDEKKAEEIRMKYRHPLWKTVGELAKRVGGHGGMDFIMDARWAYCLQQGLPLDMDVYDLAATSCLCELTEKSVDNRSRAYDIPDFTRGAWRTNKPMGIVDIDLAKMDFGPAATKG